MRSMAVVVGKETRAGFNMKAWLDNGGEGSGLECWGPVININTDPRWGRNGEGGAEDPYLMGQLGAAWTTGVQVGDGKDPDHIMVAVTLKHFDANSLEGGSIGDKGLTRHTVDVNLTKYLLADEYWPAFRTSIRDAGARGVMCSCETTAAFTTPAHCCVTPPEQSARALTAFAFVRCSCLLKCAQAGLHK